jgi:hypothetical protein
VSAGIPVLLHAGVPDSGFHWLTQVIVILLIAAAWMLLARLSDRRRARRHTVPDQRPKPTVASRIARRWVPHPRRTELTDTPRSPSL